MQRIADDALPGKLRELARRDPNTQVVIQADKAVPYARVVFVMDHAKQAGLKQIALRTAP
jgi:biopolymer transport protein ExbD